jgi:8-oxo-dGTP pyrophosphatase MutT (NUDIX family)
VGERGGIVRAGRRQLRDMVYRFGGSRRWARELGVPYPERRPGYAVRWTEERVREELTAFLAGRQVRPSRKEFEAAGCKTLRDAVGRTGGIERWSAEFDLPLTDLRRGSRRVWDDARIEAELRGLLADRREWPTKAEFERRRDYAHRRAMRLARTVARAADGLYEPCRLTQWRPRDDQPVHTRDTPARGSAMTVNVRAVIWLDWRLLVHKVRHRGEERLTLPGGRVKERETAEAALAREVQEETGLSIVVGPLLYVAEVVSPYSTQKLELVFRADVDPSQELSGQTAVDPRAPEREAVLPPILDVIAKDADDGWVGAPRWLGNIYVAGVGG